MRNLMSQAYICAQKLIQTSFNIFFMCVSDESNIDQILAVNTFSFIINCFLYNVFVQNKICIQDVYAHTVNVAEASY